MWNAFLMTSIGNGTFLKQLPLDTDDTQICKHEAASWSLRSYSQYLKTIPHHTAVRDGRDQQMDTVNIRFARRNVGTQFLRALPWAGARLTAVRLTGRRQHKGTDALWWWRQQWGAASSSNLAASHRTLTATWLTAERIHTVYLLWSRCKIHLRINYYSKRSKAATAGPASLVLTQSAV